MENRTQFLNQDSITKADILNKVFAPNGFDGIRATPDLRALVYEEKRRQFSKKLVYVGVGGSLFTLYNLTRFGRLSPSGKLAAPIGFLYFAGMTFACLYESRLVTVSSKKAIPDKAQEEEKQKTE